ncbi:MAG TPA: response regulator [Candidatus Angelobacter sp.]|jgi:CheY-like chemotaxis protein|nr:response regulator [Candidatus Angelobacter sp.]
MRVLIVEDNPVDTTKCIALFKKLGAAEIEAVPTVAAALVHLEDVLDNKRPAPELIVLDLSFPLESGFEVLRRWRAHPKLQDIHIIVWTAMGETEQRLCEYFGVKGVIPKWAGTKELEQAVRASSAG